MRVHAHWYLLNQCEPACALNLGPRYLLARALVRAEAKGRQRQRARLAAQAGRKNLCAWHHPSDWALAFDHDPRRDAAVLLQHHTETSTDVQPDSELTAVLLHALAALESAGAPHYERRNSLNPSFGPSMAQVFGSAGGSSSLNSFTPCTPQSFTDT